MKIPYRRFPGIVILLVCCWLASGSLSPLYAQTFLVTSTADDEFAYAWDDTLTEDIDESIDGICMDEKRRCTLRAAISESWNLNDGNGTPVNIIITVPGTIALTQGSLYPTNGSNIKSTSGAIIDGSAAPFPMGLGSNVLLDSLTFSGGLFILGIDSENVITNCTFKNATYDAIIVSGRRNVIGGDRWTEGNTFLEMGQNAINVVGDSNWIEGNFIGIDRNGNANGNKFGVFVTGSRNTIGSSDTGYANTISGNITGIAISGDIVDHGRDNRIIGNYIGTDPSGMQKRPNATGIEIIDAIGTQIGDYLDTPPNTSRNVISGNTEEGILVGIMTGADNIAVSTYIENNIIGPDAAKQDYLPNRDGIVLGPGSTKVEVRYNTITGNDSNGIVITGFSDGSGDFSSSRHKIAHNDINGNGALFSGANTGNGIAIVGNSHDNIIGDELQDVFNNDGNTIVANHGSGVRIVKFLGISPIGNTIRENVISAHRFKGINIVDAQDGIQPPVIASAVMGPSIGRVTGTHDRVGARIDVYIAGESGYSTYWEGVTYLTGGHVQNDGSFAFNIPPCNCPRLVATATDLQWNTSEFSDPIRMNTTRHRRFRRGANAVSSSVGTTNSSTGSIFPGAVSRAYSWIGPSIVPAIPPSSSNTGSYVAQDTIAAGVGYWIKYDNEVTDSLTGFLQSEDTVDVISGWNFIGSISAPVPVSQIVSIPGGLATSQFFGYDSSYYVADTIQPGFAYWVKVNKPGSLILAVYDTLPTSGFITIVPDSELPPPPPPEVLGNTTVAQVALKQGWNMISVPINALDFNKTVIFPDAISNVFSYTAGQYVSEDTLRNGAGYWVKYGSAMNQDITGYPLPADTFDVFAGWNLIGSIGNPVPVSQITSTPGGMIASQFFGYDLFYSNADTLIPGKAYWVKVNQAGQLNLSITAAKSSNRIVVVQTEEVPPAPPGLNELENADMKPETFALHQNYPNPFNPTTTITFDIAKSGFTSLKIYDLLGREVRELLNEKLEPGRYVKTFDAADLVSGIYYCRLVAGGFVRTNKLLLIR